MTRYTFLPIEFGSICIVGGEAGLSGVRLCAEKPKQAAARMAALLGDAERDAELLPGLQADLRAYFAGEPVTFDVELDLSGLAPFHQRALKACARVPYGRTTTYKELAAKVGSPNAARAVGTAMARNPIAIVIPCHRVLAANRALGGYSAPQGLTLKRHLLEMEARGLQRLEAGVAFRATG